MASTYIKRDLSVSETVYKFTWSAWVKRSQITAHNTLFKSRTDGNNWCQCYFESDDRLILSSYKNGGYHYIFKTNRLFRDTNAFYHVMVNVDSSQSTAGDRVRIYVNGERETSFNTATNNLSNGDSLIINSSDSGTGHTIGSWNASNYLDGVLSHVHYSSGYSYAPTVFGSTDSTTGEWKINTSPSFTLGGNGYTVLKDGNTITDQSSNSNNFTLGGGTLTKTEDCPDNVFATLNAVDKNSVVVLTNGNTTSHSSDNTTWSAANRATLGIAKDKFYWEMKITGSGTANGLFFGVCSDTVRLITNQGIQDSSTEKAKGVLVFCDDGRYQLDTNSRASMTSAPAFNDILGCAVDRDNNTVKFYKNGSQVGSIDISSSPLATCSHIMPLMINFYTNTKFNFNFGNGYFGTTAVSSAGTNASGIGIFEYDVPSGYTALSTKGLNT